MKFCGTCGSQMGDEMRFCSACGAPLVETTDTPPQPAQPQEKPVSAKKPVGLIAILIIVLIFLAAAVAIFVVDQGKKRDAHREESEESSFCLQWKLDETTGILTIFGNGEMQDFDPAYELAPWSVKRGLVRTLVVEEGVTGLGDHAFEGLDQLTNVVLPQSLERIGSFCFADCVGLYTVHIPAAVGQIGEAAFRGCDNLVEFDVDSGNMAYCTASGALMTKDRTVFIQLPAHSGYTDYVIPTSAVRIEAGAFFGCHGLYSVTIPGSVSEIKELTFCGCSGLTEIVIPMSVRTIRPSAFTEKVAAGGYARAGSTRLKKIHYGGLEEWFYSMNIGTDNDNLFNATLYFVDPWDMPKSTVDYFETQLR